MHGSRGSRDACAANYRKAGRLLQISERVDGRAVDPDLEVEVVAEAAAGAADVADHVALRDRRADAGRVARLVRVAGREPAAVVDAGVVAVAAVYAARITLPAFAARIGVPAGTPMSTPSCMRPQRQPNGEVTGRSRAR